MIVRPWCPLLFAGMVCAASTADAQGESRTTSSTEIESEIGPLLASGDSGAALSVLGRTIAREPGNASAWFRQGEIALLLARPPGTGFEWSARSIRHMRLADSSLKVATMLAPDSARYQMVRAMYFLAGELPMVREGASKSFHLGLAAAERARDSTMIAAIAIELGLWYWRTYDGMAHRRRAPYELPLPHLIDESESRRDLDHLAEAYFPKSANNSGELDYLRASELFLIALRAEPGNGRAWMYSYTSLLALDAWDELEAAARTRLRAVHNDAWAWMTMGLALHRLIKEAEAAHAFDRALSIFSPTERRRLTRLSRLLRPEDSVRVANMSDADRTSTERAYWMIADPLMLTAENEHWLEFLSRVTHSELMFTNEEFHQRGADSPRGEVFIRYGPPNGIIATGPDIRGYYGHWWRYRDGLEFYFDLYGPTRMVDERSFAAQRRRYAARPSSFANVAITRSLLTVPVAITRFRGPSDSTDIVVAAEFPLRPLTSGIDLNAGELRLALTTFGGSADSASRDGESLALDLRSARAAQSLRRTWRHRFAGTEMGLRVEALQVESERGARAVAAVEAIPHSGFTMSDVLVADSVRAGSARDPRWSDLEFSATPGELVAARQLGLVWETYDLGADSTRSSAYRVDIGLVRTDGSRIGRAVARVIGGTLGRGEGRGRDDRVTVSFDRKVPARPVTLDYLTLDLGDLASGRYRLTITVTDLVTSATTERERELTIVR